MNELADSRKSYFSDQVESGFIGKTILILSAASDRVRGKFKDSIASFEQFVEDEKAWQKSLERCRPQEVETRRLKGLLVHRKTSETVLLFDGIQKLGDSELEVEDQELFFTREPEVGDREKFFTNQVLEHEQEEWIVKILPAGAQKEITVRSDIDKGVGA